MTLANTVASRAFAITPRLRAQEIIWCNLRYQRGNNLLGLADNTSVYACDAAGFLDLTLIRQRKRVGAMRIAWSLGATTTAFLVGWAFGHALHVEAQVPSQRTPFAVGACFLPLDGVVRTIIEVKEVSGTWLRTTDSTVPTGAVWINTQALGAIQEGRCRP